MYYAAPQVQQQLVHLLIFTFFLIYCFVKRDNFCTENNKIIIETMVLYKLFTKMFETSSESFKYVYVLLFL